MRPNPLFVPVALVSILVGCDRRESTSAPAPGASSAAAASSAGAPPAAAEPSDDEKGAAARITPASIAAPLRFLSDDLLEGRAPGTRGNDLAIKYIAAEMEAMGLEPGMDGKTWLQKVPLVGINARLPSTATLAAGTKSLTLAIPNDLVVMSGTQDRHSAFDADDVVFAGYGIIAPEYQWDDYKDVDVKGKIVLLMNSDPSSDPKLFAGKTRLWYGRWDYKYEQAAKKGAAAVIIIHTTPSAAYPWQVVASSNMRERFELPPTPGEARLAAKMWATDDASRKIAALGGKDLDALRRAAEAREFRPVSLGVKMALAFDNDTRTIESANVVGVLPGGDPQLAGEAIVYSAHHDHLGVGIAKNGDSIYNGALDNASGVATLLSIARAIAPAKRPRRSVVFLAVTAEEQGLLGSHWYCAHPTFAAGRIAANLNIDSVNKNGRTTDVAFTGRGKSSLDLIIEALAKAQGRTVGGDAFPEKGSFYRSDQFSFAKIGVPGVFLRGGPSFVGRPPGWGVEQATLYEKERYHQPSDEYDGSWDLSGAVEDAQLLLLAGMRIANDPVLPKWKEGDEFEPARKAALAAR